MAFRGIDAGADHLPAGLVMAPVRTSRTAPSLSRPTQVWQMPIRQPNGSVAPASSPPTRIETPASHFASASETRNTHRAAVAVTTADADDRLEPFGVQVF